MKNVTYLVLLTPIFKTNFADFEQGKDDSFHVDFYLWYCGLYYI